MANATHPVTTPPSAACAHCGLPVPPDRADGATDDATDEPRFCCHGCAIVYQALAESGMGATYYRLRDLAPGRTSARPAETPVDGVQLSELDTPAFLAEHARTLDDGTCAIDLALDGVHCAACVWLVERMPFEVAGVQEARLDLPRARLSLRWRPSDVALSAVARWLGRFGYAAHPVRRDAQTARTEAERRLLIRMGICWALAGNVMLIAFALYSGMNLAEDALLATSARWLSLLLAAGSLAVGGSIFVRRAWASIGVALRARDVRRLHMDTPIALGLLVGFGHSAWATVTGRGDVWFDSITVLIAALLTARWLQLRSRRLAGDATERLLALLPTMARRVTAGGEIEVVRADEVAAGETIEVPAGEVVPVDGTVVEGASALNNAVLTGESRPEPVAPGTAVTAGATNLRAPVRIRVAAVGDDTRVGRLLAWVRDHEGARAPVTLLVDRLSGFFVLAVLALAALTALLWIRWAPAEAVPHVVALLVITCPCALGMATPLAMAVAGGRAARGGLFVKSDEAMQQLTAVDAVVLDKTGTLTEGRMTIAAWQGDAHALDLAAALEAHSTHPIAAAFVQAHSERTADGAEPLPVDAFEATAGAGLRGWVDEHDVAVGRPDWVGTFAALPPAHADALAAYGRQGYTPVAVAMDGHVTAVCGMGDRVRTETAGAVAALKRAGKAVYVLSGDHPDAVAVVARQLGIAVSHAYGGATPEAKQAFVEALQAEGRTVAMVGDGVNDAAALQAADVGIAVHGGSTASLVAADAFMTREGLAPLTELFAGAERVLFVIKRNLALSLLYNVLGAAAAIAGLVTPLVAAVAMPLSSLAVVASSIAQRSFGSPAEGAPVGDPPTPAPRTDLQPQAP